MEQKAKSAELDRWAAVLATLSPFVDDKEERPTIYDGRHARWLRHWNSQLQKIAEHESSRDPKLLLRRLEKYGEGTFGRWTKARSVDKKTGRMVPGAQFIVAVHKFATSRLD